MKALLLILLILNSSCAAVAHIPDQTRKDGTVVCDKDDSEAYLDAHAGAVYAGVALLAVSQGVSKEGSEKTVMNTIGYVALGLAIVHAASYLWGIRQARKCEMRMP